MRKTAQSLTILILAAEGDYDGWHGDVPRQLVPIAGEPLLVRVVRELGERGYSATVVTDIKEVTTTTMGCNLLLPSKVDTIFHTMLSTKHLWLGRVLFLLGDVFYTDEFYDLMLEYDGEMPVCFDSFGLLFNEADYDHVTQALHDRSADKAEPFFNRLWIKSGFKKVGVEEHYDFDIVPYYEKFLEENPWAR